MADAVRDLTVFGRMRGVLESSYYGMLHHLAVVIARQGNANVALNLLKPVLKNAWSLGVVFDQIVILSWAEQPRQAVEVFQSLPRDCKIPNYVLLEIGSCFRKIQQHQAALSISQQILEEDPNHSRALEDFIGTSLELNQLSLASETLANIARRNNLGEEWLLQIKNTVLRLKAVYLARHGMWLESLEIFDKLSSLSPSCSPIAFDHILVLNWANKHSQAVERYRLLDPSCAIPKQVRLAVADSFCQLNNIQQALEIYKSILANDPDDEATWDLLLGAFLRAEDYSKAEELLKQRASLVAVEQSWLDKSQARIWLQQAINLANKGGADQSPESYEHSRELLLRVLELTPKDSLALDNLMRLYQKRGAIRQDYEPVKEFFEPDDKSLVWLKPYLLEQKRKQALKLAQQGRCDYAVEWMDQLAHSNREPSFLIDYIHVLVCARRYSDAVAQLSNIPKEFHIPDQVTFEIAQACMEVKQYNLAVDYYLQYLASHDDPWVFLHVCAAFLAAGRSEEIHRFIEQRYADRPEWASYFQAEILLQQGRIEPAQKKLTQVAISKANVTLMTRSFAYLHILMGDYEGANAFLSKISDRVFHIHVIEELPLNTASRISLARYLSGQGQLEEANSLLDKALINEPSNIDLLFEKARLLERMQRPFAAIKVLERILEIRPGDETALNDKASILLTLSSVSPAKVFIASTGSGLATDLNRSLHWQQLRAQLEGLPEYRSRIESLAIVDLHERNGDDLSELPAWLLRRAAEALVDRKQQKRALSLLRKATLDGSNMDDQEWFDFRITTAHCLTLLGDYSEAKKILDQLESEQSSADRVGVSQKSWRLEELQRERGWWLISQDRLSEAQEHFEGLHRLAPFNTDFRFDLASVYQFRGWPRKALESFSILDQIESEKEPKSSILCQVLDELGDFEPARSCAKKLFDSNPENYDNVQLTKQFELQLRPRVTVYSDFSHQGSFLDGNTVSTKLDVPIQPRLSLNAEVIWKSAMEGNRRKDVLVANIGWDWRINRDVSTFGHLSFEAFSTLPGGAAGVAYSPSDHFSFSLGFDSDSLSLPPKALFAGVEGMELSASARYRYSESFSTKATITELRLSDANWNTTSDLNLETTVFTRAAWKIQLILSGEGVTNTQPSVEYYSPSWFFCFDGGARLDHVWFKSIGYTFKDQIGAEVGAQKETSVHLTDRWKVDYEQNHEIGESQRLMIGAGIFQRNYGESTILGWSLVFEYSMIF